MDTEMLELIEKAEEARGKMQGEKKRNKVQVRYKYADIIRREVAELDAAAEAEFAAVLAELHDEGVPQGVIRREVLRTSDWSVWTYWRDLAGIPPARGRK